MLITPEQLKESERLARRVALVFYKETDDSILSKDETSQGMVRQLADMILNWIPIPPLLAAQEKLVRMTDLVRHQRAELHEAGLITDSEYAQLSAIQGSPERLESYDQLRAELAHMREERDDAFRRGYENAEALRKQLIEAQA